MIAVTNQICNLVQVLRPIKEEKNNVKTKLQCEKKKSAKQKLRYIRTMLVGNDGI